jgi:hypothetical protein
MGLLKACIGGHGQFQPRALPLCGIFVGQPAAGLAGTSNVDANARRSRVRPNKDESVRFVRKSPIMCNSGGDFTAIRIRKGNINLLARGRVCVRSHTIILPG